MAIYDNNGTTNYEIGKLYDNDGTTNHQISKVYDNDGTASSLIYNSAPESIYQNGTLNSEVFSSFSNGLSIQANGSATDNSGTGSGGWGSGSASTSATSTALGGLTGVRITGTINLYTYSWSQHSASGSGTFKWSGGSKELVSLSHQCYGSPDYSVNSNKGFDVTINGTFSSNETFTFTAGVSLGVWGSQSAGGGAALTITGIYPIS